MAILKIARMGHPVLTIRAEPVENPEDPRIHGLIADMVETMADAGGIGLAAPQVHMPFRVMIFRVPEERTKDGSSVPLTALINPTVEFLTSEMDEEWEGCLSLPGMTGRVPRAKRIRYTGVGLDGKEIDREAEGYHARVVQHEYDHLEGILYPMRMTDLSSFGFREEMTRAPWVTGEEGDEDEGNGEAGGGTAAA